jgi:hypothetical protein
MTICHLHYAKSEEHNNNDDMNSSDCENSYVHTCVFVPDEELDGLTNGRDKSNTLDETPEMNIDTDCMDTDCIDTDCSTSDCINANFKHANCINTDHIIQICTSYSYDMNLNRVTDSHVELNILDNTQECLNNSHHKISFDHGEDTTKN